MKRTMTKAVFIVLTGISACAMSACTTVDLSQVSFEPQAKISVERAHNVVEKAAHSMMALFEKKGWCKTDLREKTQTAASVLLNGMDKEEHTPVPTLIVSTQQLSEDIELANEQVEQITKAAEVYMATTEDTVDMGDELTLLESALLTAREAETGFDISLDQVGTAGTQRKFGNFQASIKDLKSVTDIYGDRMRAQIALRSQRERS